MTIDRIDWHYGAQGFPENMPIENAGNHIGYFMEFLYKHGCIPDSLNNAIEEYEKVKNGEVSGVRFLIDNCDSKFWDVDTNEIGLNFTNYIYDYYLTNLFNIIDHSTYEYSYSSKDYELIEKWLEEIYTTWIDNGMPLKIKGIPELYNLLKDMYNVEWIDENKSFNLFFNNKQYKMCIDYSCIKYFIKQKKLLSFSWKELSQKNYNNQLSSYDNMLNDIREWIEKHN